jgi:hypothetical protein
MTWNEDRAKETLENHNSQEDTHLQTDRCQGLNDDMITIVSSKRLWKPPITRKDDFFLWTDISRTKLGLAYV